MMNYLKRRFSSGDLQGEGLDEDENSNQLINLANPILNKFTSSISSTISPTSLSQPQQQLPPPPQLTPNRPPLLRNQASLSSADQSAKQTPNAPTRPQNIPNTTSTPLKKGPSPSAPNSHTKNMSITSMMSAAKDILSNNINTVMQPQSSSNARQMVKEKAKNLLVIDESNVDWSRFFKNRKVCDYELRIEQVIDYL